MFFIAFASPEDRQDLISELNLMSRIEPHRNVVGLIGCVTTEGKCLSILWKDLLKPGFIFRRVLASLQ